MASDWMSYMGWNCYVPVHKGGTRNYIFVSQLAELDFPKTSDWNYNYPQNKPWNLL